jgi:hypothetical protein
MTFLNAALLGGLLAVAIPIVIHLFHRSRFKVVRWGAMHLLESVLRKNTRRLRLEQLILLLIRCSIPVALALLMARPVITGLEPLLGNAKSSTVILLDNSYSMEAGGLNRSNYLQAREAARQVIENLVPGSEVAVVQMAGGVSVLLDEPTVDLERMRDELVKSRSGFGSASVPEALDRARGLLARMHETHREVVVLSDFQQVSWSESETAQRMKLADALRAGPVERKLTLFRVGSEITDNVSVESLDFSRMILGVGQQLRVRATLRNHGEGAYPDLRVVLRVDGKDRLTYTAALDPHSTVQVLFTWTFDTSGSHVVEVAADADPLQADNSMMASIPVWDRVPVLLVSGDSNPEPLRGETDFVEIALRPFGAARAELADLVTTKTVEARELDAKMLAEARVVLLANVPQLAEPQLRALETFVKEGGGLLVFPGNRINSSWYNTTLFQDGKGLLPLPVASLAGSLNQQGTHASIVSQHYEHPALEMFNDPRNGNLSDAQVWLWYRMREEASAARAAETGLTVIAKLDSGDPFLVEKKLGEGRVIQSAIPCDADWSNLPMRPFYLPLMQQIVTYLASKVHPPRNVEVGKALVAFLPAADAGKKALMTDPDGRAHELAIAARGARAAVEFGRTQRPGLYVLDAPGSNRIHFVVNTDRKESDLRRLSDEQLDLVAKPMGATVVKSWGDYRQLDQQRRFGQEIWQALLGALIGLVFVEVLLEQYFARRKG